MSENKGYDVMITVRGRQVYADGTPDSSEMMTQGKLYPREDGFALEYEETEITGMEGTTTSFVREGDVVSLTRSGSFNSQMVFQEGRQHSSLYRTPYGTLDVDIRTGRIRSSINELGGVMEIDYDIAVQKQLMSKNRFQIRVKRKNLRQEI